MLEKTVFLAEGENHVRAAIRLKINLQPGFKFQGEAENAENLLAQVCQHPPGVILLDWNLPGMNPQRLIPTLRANCPNTILVAISVKPEIEMVVNEYQLDGFILKQLLPNEFIEQLLDALSVPNDDSVR